MLQSLIAVLGVPGPGGLGVIQAGQVSDSLNL